MLAVENLIHWWVLLNHIMGGLPLLKELLMSVEIKGQVKTVVYAKDRLTTFANKPINQGHNERNSLNHLNKHVEPILFCFLLKMSKGPAVGIDLGTTYSCVGIFQHGKVEIIANDQGNRTTPSYVAFTDTERLIGDAAKNQVAMNPSNTVFGKKKIKEKTII